jgi:hypothetical protein
LPQLSCSVGARENPGVTLRFDLVQGRGNTAFCSRFVTSVLHLGYIAVPHSSVAACSTLGNTAVSNTAVFYSPLALGSHGSVNPPCNPCYTAGPHSGVTACSTLVGTAVFNTAVFHTLAHSCLTAVLTHHVTPVLHFGVPRVFPHVVHCSVLHCSHTAV